VASLKRGRVNVSSSLFNSFINFRWLGGNCAVTYGGGGGWWYNSCAYARLNNRWGEGQSFLGIAWHTWKQWTHLKSSMMMVRCTVWLFDGSVLRMCKYNRWKTVLRVKQICCVQRLCRTCVLRNVTYLNPLRNNVIIYHEKAKKCFSLRWRQAVFLPLVTLAM